MKDAFAHAGRFDAARLKATVGPPLWYHRKHHDADHEAFLSLGCAMICWQSLRKAWMTG
jgi:hypothetical protein